MLRSDGKKLRAISEFVQGDDMSGDVPIDDRRFLTWGRRLPYAALLLMIGVTGCSAGPRQDALVSEPWRVAPAASAWSSVPNDEHCVAAFREFNAMFKSASKARLLAAGSKMDSSCDVAPGTHQVAEPK
jgi:hypothetical protein